MKNLHAVAAFIVALAFMGQVQGDADRFRALRIAHAGGGLAGVTYTNSYEALSTNINKGYRYFEIDFTYTSDEQLVCLHDWGRNFEKIFGFSTEQPLSLAEFERLAGENRNSTNCTLAGLARWMKKNPTARIVTDVRGDNLKALQQISRVLPDHERRVIPQIYKPGNFQKVQDMGYEQIIWTLYRFSGINFKVIEWVDSWKTPVAITMPRERAETALPRALAGRGIPTYVHTINDMEEMRFFIEDQGVSEIYTDFLDPDSH